MCFGNKKGEKHPKGNVPASSLSEWLIEPESLTDEIREMYILINKLKRSKTIVLLWLEEKSYQEIAEITGITLSNVATKLKRAKQKLKEMSNY